MASRETIANMALSNLGADRIVSLSDNTVSAKEVSARYNIVAESVMSMGAWPSCRRRAALALLDETPAFGFSYIFQLPTDPKCLRVLRLNEARLGAIPYMIEGSKILTNTAEVSIIYIALLDNTESYDTFLMQAIIAQLSASMAYKFTGQAKVAESLITKFDADVKRLLGLATSQGSNERLPSDDYLDARRNMGTRLVDDWNVDV